MSRDKSDIIVNKISDSSIEIRVEHYTSHDCLTCYHFERYGSKCDYLAGVCYPDEYRKKR